MPAPKYIAMMMNDTMFSPSPDWNNPTTGEVTPPPGPAAVAGDLTATSSSGGCGTRLSPQSCLSKTVRRRSKPSRKTHTTLLNANSTNFRALVQQFTGCPTNPLSFGAQKGPLNLNFGGQQDHYHYQSSSSATPSVVAPIAYKVYNHHHDDNHQQYSQPQQQQDMYSVSSFNHFASNQVFLGGEKENVKVVGDGLLMDHVPCSLHDRQLLVKDSSNFLMMSTEVDRVLNDGYFI